MFQRWGSPIMSHLMFPLLEFLWTVFHHHGPGQCNLVFTKDWFHIAKLNISSLCTVAATASPVLYLLLFIWADHPSSVRKTTIYSIFKRFNLKNCSCACAQVYTMDRGRSHVSDENSDSSARVIREDSGFDS